MIKPLTDEELLSYALVHCHTERALFHIDTVRKLYEMAGEKMPAVTGTSNLGPNFIKLGPAAMSELYTKINRRRARQRFRVIEGGRNEASV